MVDVIAKNDNIMPYVHLPVQSGSNKILKLMGRRYTKEFYKELLDKLKKIQILVLQLILLWVFRVKQKKIFKIL